MFLVIWMFLIRPERKRQREAQDMRNSLKKGDTVELEWVYDERMRVVAVEVVE